MEELALKSFYKGKKVFVTGHTGFKGAWMALWLKELGAEVTGYALPPEDQRGNLFKQAALAESMRSVEGDLCDLKALKGALNASGASLVFHLAAQPLVLRSYEDPLETYQSNVMGTASLLEAVRQSPTVKTVVVVTTDKCYENHEWPWPYRETDALGGHDPYSSSKAMAEIVTAAYRRSFLQAKGVGVATGRAGNVIGGGDWARWRIIPDIVESIAKGESVVLRNPRAVRPWQHVLDALHGYLVLGQKLAQDPAGLAEAFNFSPREASSKHTVLHITETFIAMAGKGSVTVDESTRKGHEAGYLTLDPSKAGQKLGWVPLWDTDEALRRTAGWYVDFLKDPGAARALTLRDIKAFMDRTGNV